MEYAAYERKVNAIYDMVSEGKYKVRLFLLIECPTTAFFDARVSSQFPRVLDRFQSISIFESKSVDVFQASAQQ